MRLWVSGDGAEETRTLYNWLRADQGLTRHAEIRAGGSDPTRMGALDVIDIVLSQVTGLSALALAVASWRQSRSRPQPVTITRPDGETLVFHEPQQVDPEIIKAFLAADRSGRDENPGRLEP
ncbi:effector-associated constant component EACC1 [Micromonospora echinospora]